MLNHLLTTYGPIMHAKLKCNCASITTIWTLDDPIKTLWECICKIQKIASAGNNPLTDTAIIKITYTMFKTTGMFTNSCDTWCVCPDANKMLIEFCCMSPAKSKLTTIQVSFHSTHATISAPTKPTTGYLHCKLKLQVANHKFDKNM